MSNHPTIRIAEHAANTRRCRALELVLLALACDCHFICNNCPKSYTNKRAQDCVILARHRPRLCRFLTNRPGPLQFLLFFCNSRDP
jgi:hypothetical protein